MSTPHAVERLKYETLRMLEIDGELTDTVRLQLLTAARRVPHRLEIVRRSQRG